MILVVVKIRVRAEMIGEWRSLMEEFMDATRAEPGNIGFDLSRGVEDPSVYVLIEAFRDGPAGAAHVGSEHFKAAMERLPRLIAEVPEIVNVDVPNGWARMSEVQLDSSG
jgi:quinol monooxygenase YgiN